MSSTINRLLAFGIVIGLFLLFPLTVSAYKYYNVWSIPAVLDPPNETFWFLECSIPHDGQAATDFRKGNRQWNWIYGMYDYVKYDHRQCSGTKIWRFNDLSEVAFVPDSEVNEENWTGAAKVHATEWETYAWNDELEIWREETDIVFNQSVDWKFGRESCLSISTKTPFRRTAIHEVGHALGLDHPGHDKEAIMVLGDGFGDRSGKYCGFRFRFPHPDDNAGARFLYNSGNESVEIGMSAWYRHRFAAGDWVDQTTTVNYGEQVVERCPDESVKVYFSYANRGTQDNEANFEIYWSEDVFITDNDDILIASYGPKTFPTATFKQSSKFSVAVPDSATAGETYYIGVNAGFVSKSQGWFHTNDHTPLEPKVKIKQDFECQ